MSDQRIISNQTTSGEPRYQVVQRNGAPWSESLVSGIGAGLMAFFIMTNHNLLYFVVLILYLIWSIFTGHSHPSAYNIKRTSAPKTVTGYIILYLFLGALLYMMFSNGVATFTFALSASVGLGLLFLFMTRFLLPANYKEPVS